MAHTYHDLHGMSVAQLREIAAEIEHDAVHGHSTMHKEPLVQALCEALGISKLEHHEVTGIDKSPIKAEIRALKVDRGEAQAAGDRAEMKRIRRRIHRLKHKLRRATV